ncbi:MAG TPA: hypothetical protein VMU16_01130 [Candidatus Binataceae bacterium]|nr:hypothetical protein [Candidatus Binataceae bacterium]
MHTATGKQESRSNGGQGVVYRTVCQNPGCGYKFDLRITPENAGLLSGSISCPHCKRHGGFLKPQGRIGEKVFAAKLLFHLIGVGPARGDDEDVTGEFGSPRY